MRPGVLLTLILFSCLNLFADVSVGDTEASALSQLGEVKGKIVLPNKKVNYTFDRGEITVSEGKVVSAKLEPIEDYNIRKNNEKLDKKVNDWSESRKNKRAEVEKNAEGVLSGFYISRDSFTGEYTIYYPKKEAYLNPIFYYRKGGRIEAQVDGEGKITVKTYYVGSDWIFHDNFLLKINNDNNFYTSPKTIGSPHRDTVTINDEVLVYEVCFYTDKEVVDALAKVAANKEAEVMLRLAGRNYTLTMLDKYSISLIFQVSEWLKEGGNIDPEVRKIIKDKIQKLSIAE